MTESRSSRAVAAQTRSESLRLTTPVRPIVIAVYCTKLDNDVHQRRFQEEARAPIGSVQAIVEPRVDHFRTVTGL